MLGDSITEGGNWAELLKGYDVANYGIGGDTTTGILYRLSDVYMAHPSKVFLMVGINDISSYLTKKWDENNIETIFGNYKNIINDLREHDIEVVIQSTLNTSQKSFQMEAERNIDVEKLNELLKKYCEEGNIKFLDINQSLSKAGILIEKYTGDGVHLNYEGYKIWREKILSVL
jgi:lysophospholipase L1-like esterase